MELLEPAYFATIDNPYNRINLKQSKSLMHSVTDLENAKIL